jgi:hypothetical protein
MCHSQRMGERHHADAMALVFDLYRQAADERGANQISVCPCKPWHMPFAAAMLSTEAVPGPAARSSEQARHASAGYRGLSAEPQLRRKAGSHATGLARTGMFGNLLARLEN